MRLPSISVVVIGRNEGARLVRCLESVRAARAAQRLICELDIIYVDSASGDDSVVVAGLAGAQVIRLDAARPSAALARNAGWQASNSEFILFLDGDTILDPDFIAVALAALAAPEVAIVWGHRRELALHSGRLGRIDRIGAGSSLLLVRSYVHQRIIVQARQRDESMGLLPVYALKCVGMAIHRSQFHSQYFAKS